MKNLSTKHDLFCKEYVSDKHLNATRAYMAVYKVKGENTAAVCANKLLRNAKIKARIEELMAERAKRLEITADDVLREIWAIASARITDFAKIKTVEKTRIATRLKQVPADQENTDSDDKKPKVELEDYEETYLEQEIEVLDTDQMDPDKIAAIASIKPGKNGGIELKQFDKNKALENTMRHLGMFEIDNKQKSDKIVVGYTPVDEEEDDE